MCKSVSVFATETVASTLMQRMSDMLTRWLESTGRGQGQAQGSSQGQGQPQSEEQGQSQGQSEENQTNTTQETVRQLAAEIAMEDVPEGTSVDPKLEPETEARSGTCAEARTGTCQEEPREGTYTKQQIFGDMSSSSSDSNDDSCDNDENTKAPADDDLMNVQPECFDLDLESPMNVTSPTRNIIPDVVSDTQQNVADSCSKTSVDTKTEHAGTSSGVTPSTGISLGVTSAVAISSAITSSSETPSAVVSSEQPERTVSKSDTSEIQAYLAAASTAEEEDTIESTGDTCELNANKADVKPTETLNDSIVNSNVTPNVDVPHVETNSSALEPRSLGMSHQSPGDNLPSSPSLSPSSPSQQSQMPTVDASPTTSDVGRLAQFGSNLLSIGQSINPRAQSHPIISLTYRSEGTCTSDIQVRVFIAY